MFVFLSPQSADSKWIHFEAGCAYAKDIRVVPVCLPGIDLNRITPPLSLLQGFNLHSHEALGNIVRICNDQFNATIDESFNVGRDFRLSHNNYGPWLRIFGEQSWTIDKIEISIKKKLPDINFNPIPAFHEICKKAGMNCFVTMTAGADEPLSAKFEQPGCQIWFHRNEDDGERQARFKRNRLRETTGAEEDKPKSIDYDIRCTLSPELFHLNAPLLDQWFVQAGIENSFNVAVHFVKQIDLEGQRHRLTTGYINMVLILSELDEKSGFVFDEKEFSIQLYGKIPYLWFKLDEKLEDKRLAIIIEII